MSVKPAINAPLPTANPNWSPALKVLPTAKAKAAAQEFEQVFLSNVLTQMFSGLHGEGPLGDEGPGGEVWRSFLTDQYARQITSAGGIGIAAHVMRELVNVQETAQ